MAGREKRKLFYLNPRAKIWVCGKILCSCPCPLPAVHKVKEIPCCFPSKCRVNHRIGAAPQGAPCHCVPRVPMGTIPDALLYQQIHFLEMVPFISPWPTVMDRVGQSQGSTCSPSLSPCLFAHRVYLKSRGCTMHHIGTNPFFISSKLTSTVPGFHSKSFSDQAIYVLVKFFSAPQKMPCCA